MPTSVLITGHDPITADVGKSAIAALKAYAEAHALKIEANCVPKADPGQVAAADTVVLVPGSLEPGQQFDRDVIAALKGILVVAGDTYRAWTRVPRELRNQVDRLTVCFDDEVEQARAEGYHCPISVVVPPHWQAICDKITNAPVVGPDEEITVKTTGGEARYRRGNIKVIYLGGIKDPPEMTALIQPIAASLPPGAALDFGAHPTEWEWRNDVPEEELARLGEQRNAALAGVALQVDPSIFGKGSAAQIPNAELCIFAGGGPTDMVALAYLRRGQIYCCSQALIDRNKRMGMPDGRWFVEARGAAVFATPETLGEEVSYLLANPNALREKQEETFPLPDWDKSSLDLAKAILGN